MSLSQLCVCRLKTCSMLLLSICLPHDWFAFLAEHNLLDDVLGANHISSFWHQVQDDDPKLTLNKCKDVAGWKHKFIPLQFHGDAGPHTKTDSMMVNSIRSLLTDSSVDTSMLMLGAIPEACRASKRRCKELGLPFEEDTAIVVGKIWAWSFEALFQGKHPETDPFGNPWLKTSWRAKVAGKMLCPRTHIRSDLGSHS